MKTARWILFLLVAATTVCAAELRYKGVRPDFIIDVRTPQEYAGGHIDGAINVPVERIQDVRSVKGLKPDSTILLYCRSGRRSATAAEVLGQQGYAHVLDGGGIETLARALKPCDGSAC